MIEAGASTLDGEMMPAIGTNIAPPMLAMIGGHHEGDQLDVGGVVAEEADALLGVAGGDQQLAVAAAVELPQRSRRNTISRPAAIR